MSIDREVKVRLVLDAQNALNSVDSLKNILKDISSINLGEINKMLSTMARITQEANRELTKNAQNVEDVTRRVARATQAESQAVRQELTKEITLWRQVAEARKNAEQAWRNGSPDFNAHAQKFHYAQRQFMDFKRDLSDISVGQEKTYLEKMLRGISKDNPIWQEIHDEIVKLKVESKELSSIGKDVLNPTPAFKANGLPTDFKTYSSQISDLNRQAEMLFQTMQKTNDLGKRNDLKNQLMGIKAELTSLEGASNDFLNSMGKQKKSLMDIVEYWDYFLAKSRSHLTWIASGMILASLIELPMNFVHNFAQIEQGMAGMKQVNVELEHSQKLTNKVMVEFIDIAEEYGEKVENIIEAGKLWGRMYKNLDTVNAMTQVSAKLAVADNFSLVEANLALEATLSQLGWRSENTAKAMAYAMRVTDSWTKVAHNAQISAQDLAMGMERTTAVAKLVGVSFDETVALVASGVKNTGRSGAEIGNMLKTVFGSIRSNKAVGEIEKLGVATKYVGEDGVKHWRRVTDIILDLAIQAKGTTKDVEGLMKAVAGGKFQWSKFASALDYQEIIRVMQLSIDSAGFTDRQIEMQMDTIIRKSEQLKASIDGLFSNVATSGVAQEIKGGLDSLIRFVQNLQEIPLAVWHTTEILVKLTLGIKVLGMTIDWLSNAIKRNTLAKLENTNVTNFNTLANEGNNASAVENSIILGANGQAIQSNTAVKTANMNITRALTVANSIFSGGLTIVGGALALASIAMLGYGMFANKAKDSVEELKRKEQQRIASMTQQIDVSQRMTEYVDTLSQAHDKLTESLKKNGEHTEKGKKLKEDLMFTDQQLAEAIGTSTEEIQKSEESRQTLIENYKKAKNEQVRVLRHQLNEEITAQNNALDEQIKITDSRINDLGRLIKAMDWVTRAFYNMHNEMASINQTIEDMTQPLGKVEEKVGQFMVKLGSKTASPKGSLFINPVAPFLTAGGMELIAHSQGAERYKNIHLEKKENIKNKELDKWNAKKHELTNEKINNYGKLLDEVNTGFDYDPTLGGYDVDPATGKPVKTKNPKDKGSAGSTSPESKAHIQARYELQEKLNRLYNQSKISADQYAEALDDVNIQEEIHGKSAHTILQRLGALSDRQNQLNKETEDYKKLQEEIQGKLDKRMGSDKAFQANVEKLIPKWKDMSSEERRQALLARKEFLNDYKLYQEYIEVLGDLDVKLAEIHKQSVVVGNDIKKIQKGDSENPQKIYSNTLDDLEVELQKRMNNIDKYSPIASIKEKTEQLYILSQKLKAIEEEMARVNGEIAKLGDSADASEFKDYLQDLTKQAEQVRGELKRFQISLDDVKKGFADIVISMVQEGRNFRDIWKELWNGLARDAIYALLRIQNNAPGLLTQLLGLFGGGGGKPRIQGDPISFTVAHNGESISGFPKMHGGGNVVGGTPVVPHLENDEVIRTLQVGEEVNSIQQRRSNEILGAVAMKAIQSQQEKPNIININAVDSRSFVEFLDAHGEALLAILRKQNALGNR